jgi:hypothetical protein
MADSLQKGKAEPPKSPKALAIATHPGRVIGRLSKAEMVIVISEEAEALQGIFQCHALLGSSDGALKLQESLKNFIVRYD